MRFDGDIKVSGLSLSFSRSSWPPPCPPWLSRSNTPHPPPPRPPPPRLSLLLFALPPLLPLHLPSFLFNIDRNTEGSCPVASVFEGFSFRFRLEQSVLHDRSTQGSCPAAAGEGEGVGEGAGGVGRVSLARTRSLLLSLTCGCICSKYCRNPTSF